MFFALLKKNRERNMATPEETRDRIKEMRDRIFNDSDKNSAENKKNTKRKYEKNCGQDAGSRKIKIDAV